MLRFTVLTIAFVFSLYFPSSLALSADYEKAMRDAVERTMKPVLQLFDLESVPLDAFGYSPEPIVDVLRNLSFLQTDAQLHSISKLNVPITVPEVRDIMTEILNQQLLPLLTCMGLKPEGMPVEKDLIVRPSLLPIERP